MPQHINRISTGACCRWISKQTVERSREQIGVSIAALPENECGSQLNSKAIAFYFVRLGSEADICAATSHVRFTPNSERGSSGANGDVD